MSKNGATEYQIEYRLTRDARHFEYRVRRGTRGTWVGWFATNNIYKVMANLGFGGKEPTWSDDFYFESYFGRGEIRINQPMFKFIARRAGYQPMNTYLYSRLKQIEPDVWILPASALNTKKLFKHMKDIIQSHS